MTNQFMPPELTEIPAGHLNIMGYVDESAVNGPGTRAVVWVQGCLRECAGCFNCLPQEVPRFIGGMNCGQGL
jgi:pyruvate-formate lyase-activating enzyme